MSKLKLTLLCSIILLLALIGYLKKKETPKVKRSIKKRNEGTEEENLPPFGFDDLYDPRFSYSSFNPNWVSESEYVYRDSMGIQKGNLATSSSEVIVPGDFYDETGADGWRLSADEKYVLLRKNYTKQWRHSYNGSYSVYDVNTLDLIWESGRSDIQYAQWSPTGHALLWVVENNLYFKPNLLASEIAMETNGGKNAIFNGIPDWVYEEEMVSSNNNIFWSPNSQYIAYLVTNDTGVEKIQFTTYKSSYQYPQLVEIGYPKAGTKNPTVTLKVYDTVRRETFEVEAPTEEIGVDHLFCSFFWHNDSLAFQVDWLNRISNKAVPQLCQYDISNEEWTCSVIQAGIEESKTGWIGNGGVTFRPIQYDSETKEYLTIQSDPQGYWHVVLVNAENNIKTFMTSGNSVVTSLRAYDSTNSFLYFTAAHPKPRERHLYRISLSSQDAPLTPDQWLCVTCQENFDSDRCKWTTPNFSPTLTYLVINCGGPDVPMSYLLTSDGNGYYDAPEVVINNDELIMNKQLVKWPIKEYGQFQGLDDTTILYQVHKPMDFDDTREYPLLIEVYGGPGFQKVQDRFTSSWAPIHLVSQYDIIVVSLDGRGSGYRGDKIAHMLYKKIGQLEKVDTTDVALHFSQKPWIDASRIAVWGWSYGGYTTTFTISEGSGVFKCGMAVAPLASRFYYDTIHTERYMTMPANNTDGYEKCNILNSDLNNFKKASYSIIHGTADDNVHFQNAAIISKALVTADVEFDNFFYADEAHSINTGKNANKHVYQLLTRKVRKCFDLEAPISRKRKSSKFDWYFKMIMKRSTRKYPFIPTTPISDFLKF